MASLPAAATDAYGVTSALSSDSQHCIRVEAKVAISGVAQAGDPVSGTKVEVTCEARAYGEGATNPYYTDAQLYRAKLTIGGVQVYDESGEFLKPNPQPIGGGMLMATGGGGTNPPQEAAIYQDRLPWDARFASTHFSHDAAFAVNLHLWFKLTKAAGGEDDIDVQAEISPKAFNKLTSWRRTVDTSGQPETTANQAIVDAVLQAGRNAFTNANYGNSGAPMSLAKSAIIGYLSADTAVFADTHGLSTGIADSTGWTTGSTNFMTFDPDISTATGVGLSTRLPHQIVVLYACQALATNNIPTSFNVAGLGGCVLGFANDVRLLTVSINPVSGERTACNMDLHTQKLMDNLGSGMRANDALRRTNYAYRVLYQDANGNWFEQNMLLQGDGNSTFKSVYLTDDERDTVGTVIGPTMGDEAEAPKAYADWKISEAEELGI